MPVFAQQQPADGPVPALGIAAARRALGLPLAEQELAAMDLFDEVARAPRAPARVLSQARRHARHQQRRDARPHEEFVEHPEPKSGGATWCGCGSTPRSFRAVPREVHLFAVKSAVPPQPGRSCTALRLQAALPGRPPCQTGRYPTPSSAKRSSETARLSYPEEEHEKSRSRARVCPGGCATGRGARAGVSGEAGPAGGAVPAGRCDRYHRAPARPRSSRRMLSQAC